LLAHAVAAKPALPARTVRLEIIMLSSRQNASHAGIERSAIGIVSAGL
jgi:hypothetical protein